MIVYLDTSIILRVLLRQRAALRAWARWDAAHSSEILKVEGRRVLDRLRLLSVLDDDALALAHEELGRIEESIAFIPLTPRVLRRASAPLPTAVKTLDAVHLATALLFQERCGKPLVFATHDRQQSTAARVLGFRCVG